MEIQPKKITLGLVVSWILGIICIIVGITQFGSNVLAAVIFLVTALVLLPPVNKFTTSKMGFSISGGLKFIIVLVLLIICGVIIGKGNKTPVTTTNTNSPTVTNTQNPEVAIKISAVKLSEEYNANKVAADAKYKDKLLEVSGTVDSIGKDILDTPYVTLVGRQYSLFGLQCMFAESDEPELATLSKGQSIVLQGRVSGELVGNVIAKGCKIVK